MGFQEAASTSTGDNSLASTSLLIDVLNLRATGIEDIIVTSDGHFIGQAPGDIGYNVFIGKPSHHPGPGMEHSREVWAGFTDAERAAVTYRAAHPVDGAAIPLAEFLGE